MPREFESQCDDPQCLGWFPEESGYIERCDTCGFFADDGAAARAVAERFGVRVESEQRYADPESTTRGWFAPDADHEELFRREYEDSGEA